MDRPRLRGLPRRRVVLVVALTALAGGLLVSAGGPVAAAPKPATVPAASGLNGVKGGAERTEYARAVTRQRESGGGTSLARRPAVPAKGPVAVLVQLDTQPTTAAYRASLRYGTAAATRSARAQTARIAAMQRTVASRMRAVAPRSRVLYQVHNLVAGLAVQTGAASVDALRALPGVEAVYPIAPKHLANAGAVPLQGGPAVWQALGDLGQNVTVGVIDSGIDYTHADFGGPGTTAAFVSNPRYLVDPSFFPTAKVVGGFDFAGDSYNADSFSTDPRYPYQPRPGPDPNPIDCRYFSQESTLGHGTHVAGSLAGLGVNANRTTYTGPYDNTTPFDTLRVGPGMAPRASLYALRVFGCAGSTELVGQALDWAMDPNHDGNLSDRLDVVNMSLGSDFGSPQDGDSVLSNAAAQAGIVVVSSAGNGGDVYDASGSPGNAQRVLSAASTDDGFTVLDALHVNTPASLVGDYLGSLSTLYDYVYRSGTVGSLSLPLSDANKDGCDPFSPEDAAKVAGKIAFLYADGFSRCGSTVRTNNAQTAGAVGVVIVDDGEGLRRGIYGNSTLAAILVQKSTGDLLLPQLAAGVNVRFTVSLQGTMRRAVPAEADVPSEFTARGTRGSGNVKPDVAAVGQAVFSADAGSGGRGKLLSGTSMASPLTAGLAALVRSVHPEWTPEEVKADIMDTAGQDVFTGPDHSGDRYAPNRVGAGRIQAEPALANQVLAEVANDPGAVSVSFGPVAVTTGPREIVKTLRVVNKGDTAASYRLSFEPLTSVPGIFYYVDNAANFSTIIDLAPGGTALVNVHLFAQFGANPGPLTKTIDPTVARTQDGLPRQFLADASGRAVLTPLDTSRPVLRVPVYSAPRPAAEMTTAAETHLPAGAIVGANLPLVGRGVSQGTGLEQVVSQVSGYQLAAGSGRLGMCTATVTERCVAVPDDRGVDLKYVGVTTNGPVVQALGRDPIRDPASSIYFGLSSWGPWRNPTGDTTFEADIDTNRDGAPDEALILTRFVDTDVMVTVLLDLHSNPNNPLFLSDTAGHNAWFANVLPGDQDTDIFDSDSMTLGVPTSAVAAVADFPTQPRLVPGRSRINYAVFGLSAYHAQPVDFVGLSSSGRPALTLDVVRPALTATRGTLTQQLAELYSDLPGQALRIRKDLAAFRIDRPLGLLLIHHHNLTGARAQLVKVKQPSAPHLTLSSTRVRAYAPVRATVLIPASAGPPATGMVTIRVGSAGTILARGTTNNGYFARILRFRHGVYVLYADYSGDNYYLPHRTNRVTLTVI